MSKDLPKAITDLQAHMNDPSATHLTDPAAMEAAKKLLDQMSPEKKEGGVLEKKPWSPTRSSEDRVRAEEAEKTRVELEAKRAAEAALKVKLERERKEAQRLAELQEGYFGELTYRDDVLDLHKDFIPKLDRAYHFQPMTEEVCHDLFKRKPLLLIGHTGTGKTSMAEQIAARLGQPTIRANMNGQTTISDFVGFWGVRGAETYWVDGVLPFAMKNGFWLIVDELDFADAPILSVLNAVLERNGKLVLKEKGHEVIIPHPHFRLIATANACGRMAEYRSLYQGTNIMNEAFMDRFKCYIVDYMPEALEKKVLKASYPELSEQLCSKLVDLASSVRKAFVQEAVQCTFSTRRLLDWAEAIVHFQHKKAKKPVAKAAESTIFSKISKEDAAALEGFMKRLIGPEDVPDPIGGSYENVTLHDGDAPKKKMSFKD